MLEAILTPIWRPAFPAKCWDPDCTMPQRRILTLMENPELVTTACFVKIQKCRSLSTEVIVFLPTKYILYSQTVSNMKNKRTNYYETLLMSAHNISFSLLLSAVDQNKIISLDSKQQDDDRKNGYLVQIPKLRRLKFQNSCLWINFGAVAHFCLINFRVVRLKEKRF
jgi:hypothetical protein